MEIVLDEWMGIRCQERIFNISSEAELLSILEKLDTNKHTLANLSTGNSYLMVVGGNGKYVVTGEENDVLFNLTLETAPSPLVKLNAGGQYGLFEAKYIIHRELAFRCAAEYFKLGHIPATDPDFNWERID
ncbi:MULTISPECIES: hypothetical protein [Eikenella]|uniref:Immunity protein Imm1 n=1 Tax=Eikenella longinqua TaxID=1795827 RepID=A0A1A9RY66_9NEIS|nr:MULTISPECIES: hypothetical protein [Eikenella]OAM29058.1 hypothetical protein A7P95_04800 [Eikenella longinqua]